MALRRNPDDRFLRLLDRLERRLRGLEAPSSIAVPLYGFPPNAEVSGSSGSYSTAYSFLAPGTHARLAYLIQHRDDGGAGSDHSVRIVALDPAGTVQAVLDEWTNSNGAYTARSANVAIPADLQDGQAWNYAVQAKTDAGTWFVKAWSLTLTNDPRYTLSGLNV